MDARPGGPATKREPSPEGLGLNSELDLSAVGAALNLGPLALVSLGEVVTSLDCFAVNESWVPHSSPVLA